MRVASRMSIRLADLGDLPSIHAIEKACFSDPWELDSISAVLALPHMKTWVAEQGEGAERRVVGYVIGLLLGVEAEVADLAVDPPLKGKGIGGQLLDCLLNEAPAQGIEAVFLEVRESNAAARALYASRAFQEVGRRKSYYRQPVEDALILRRDFAPT